METLLLYALCTAAMFYLGSRAVITSFMWSRYPPKLASFMDCSACSGTWYGALVGLVGGYYLGLDFMGLSGARPITVAAIALCSMTWTPIVAGFVQRGFDTLGSAVGGDEPEPAADNPRTYDPIELPPVRERTVIVGETVYAEHPELANELRTITGTITPREIPIRRITIPPKDDGGSGTG